MITIVLAFALMLLLPNFVSSATNSTNSTNATNTSTTTSAPTSTSSGNSNNGDDAIDKAYQCLSTNVKDNSKLSLQEAIFTSLALGVKGNQQTVIDNAKRSGDSCWPKEGCKLKETAQVLLAYDNSGKNTADIEKWISMRNGTASDLKWYLQIDATNHEPAQCTIRYDTRENKINIGSDMKLSGSAGNCLSISSSGYWLSINNNCVDKKIEISCNQDFITNLLYEKSNGGTVYVSSSTHSAASLGTTEEQVKAKCLKTGTACDYEGTLWAAIAMQKAGNDISDYVPYLVGLAPDNTKYLASAFIYSVAGGEDQYSNIVQSQKQGKYWEIVGSPYNRYYDTSVAMLALAGSSATELENAKNYLLSIQDSKTGCWASNNIRDTAFILYSAWPRFIAGSSGSGGSGSGSGGALTCEGSGKGYSCEKFSECLAAGASTDNSYDCPGTLFCCTQKVEAQTCNQQAGIICKANEVCSGSSSPSSDGTCCIGTCNPAPAAGNACETLDRGTCRSICGDGESETSDSCGSSSEVCCAVSDGETPSSSSGGSWTWIIILVVLIVLVGLAILFRDKLRTALFKFRGKGKSSPVIRPGSPPPGYPMRPMSPRPFGLANSAPVQRPRLPPALPTRAPPRSGNKDKELEETMRKLREMSK